MIESILHSALPLYSSLTGGAKWLRSWLRGYQACAPGGGPGGWGVSWCDAAGRGDSGLQDDQWLEEAGGQVGVSDGQAAGDQGAAVVPEVPVEGDVGAAQVLAGVVKADSKGDGPVLDEALVCLVQVVHLGERHREWDLIWREREKED